MLLLKALRVSRLKEMGTDQFERDRRSELLYGDREKELRKESRKAEKKRALPTSSKVGTIKLATARHKSCHT